MGVKVIEAKAAEGAAIAAWEMATAASEVAKDKASAKATFSSAAYEELDIAFKWVETDVNAEAVNAKMVAKAEADLKNLESAVLFAVAAKKAVSVAKSEEAAKTSARYIAFYQYRLAQGAVKLAKLKAMAAENRSRLSGNK